MVKFKKGLFKYGLVIFVVILWSLLTNETSLMPTLKQTIFALVKLLKEGYNGLSFWLHFGISMKRLFLALLFATLIALPLGLVSGYFKPIRIMIEPFINFYKPLPPLSYYVLLILWLGIDEESKVMLLFLAAFAPIYIAVSSAVIHVNQKYILSAQSLGAKSWTIFKTIILPASMPEVMTGIRTAVGVCYTTLASAEMIAATSGLGWIVLDSYNYLKTDTVVAAIIVMGLTGILLDSMIVKFNKKFIFWAGRI